MINTILKHSLRSEGKCPVCKKTVTYKQGLTAHYVNPGVMIHAGVCWEKKRKKDGRRSNKSSKGTGRA